MRIFAGLAAGVALAVMLAAPVSAKNVALVIGNGAYQNTAPLPNPGTDAVDFAAFLADAGYEVTTVTDGTRGEMAAALSAFARSLQPEDTAVFYYAGHGLQLAGENYLVGVEAKLMTEFDVPAEALDLDSIMELMESRAKVSMLFIDACRNNPLADQMAKTATRSVQKGLAAMAPSGDGAMIAFAAGPGQVAFDGTGENSPFTSALIRHLGTPGLEVSVAFKRVIAEVRALTESRQEPQLVSSLSTEVFFGGGGLPAAPAIDLAEIDYAKAERLNTTRGWQLFLEKHPEGFFSELAKAALNLLMGVAEEGLTPEEAEVRLDLTAEVRREIQVALNGLGYDVGSVDGVFGGNTRRQIARYQLAAGLQETGFVSAPMLTKLGIAMLSEGAVTVSADEARKYDPDDLAGLETDTRLLAALDCLKHRDLTYGFFEGRIYIAVLTWGGTWETSRQEATRCGGDLVSINSQQENDFVFDLYSVDDRFMDVVVLWSGDTAVGGPMIGMSQDPAGREPTGGWRWSDGSPTTFTAWNDLSNSRDEEDVAMFWVDQLPGTPPDLTAIPRTWGDVGDHARSYVMEIQ